MEKDQYTLRSKEAQEVLNNPPDKTLFWGNFLILISLLMLLLILNSIRSPVKSNVEGKILSVKSSTNSAYITIAIDSTGMALFKNDKVAIVEYDNNARVQWRVLDVDRKNFSITLGKESLNASYFSYLTKNYLAHPFCKIILNTDTISALNLFKLRIMKSYRNM